MIELFESLTLGVLQEASLSFLGLCNVQDVFRTVQERMAKEMAVHRFVDGTSLTPSCFRELQVRGMPHWSEESLPTMHQPIQPSCCCASNNCSDGLSRQIMGVLADRATRAEAEEEDFLRPLAKLFPNAAAESLRWDTALALFVVDAGGSAVCYQNPKRARVLGVLEHCTDCTFLRRTAELL